MFSRIKLFSIVWSLMGLGVSVPVLADDSAGGFPLPFKQNYSEPNGITWLHLDGHPMSRRYIITPGQYKYCTFDVYKSKCTARPCEGETHLNLRLSYFDPSMNEDNGVIRQYVFFDWETVQKKGNPFQPKKPWKSVTGKGKFVTQVSYLPEENTTVIFQENKFMFWNYYWAKIKTNDTYDQILSVAMSFDFNEDTPEADRWTVLDCQNK